MKRLDLCKVEHDIKAGMTCSTRIPNIIEDCIFYDNGEPIGFYIKQVQGNLKKYIDIANYELLSDRVPKSKMKRISGGCDQYSTIIGATPKKHHLKNYVSTSRVHRSKTAQNFIKAMLLACYEAEEIIKQITPDIFERQQNIINQNIPEKYKLGRLFTSSISNFNISANYHQDNYNLKNTVNVIFCKKNNATGGNLHVPDYDATIDSCNDSLLVYPAWRNLHGVTPIVETGNNGYRNSLVFYPLDLFRGNS